MPVSPHPIEVTLYDTDNTTLKSGAKVYVKNVTRRSQSNKKTTAADGTASIDLANLPLIGGQSVEYAIGDIILIIAYSENYHDASRYVVAGNSKSQLLYLNPLRHLTDVEKESVIALVVSNTTSTVYYARLLNSRDGRTICHVECPANNCMPVYLGGLACNGGIVLERENKGLIVTASIK